MNSTASQADQNLISSSVARLRSCTLVDIQKNWQGCEVPISQEREGLGGLGANYQLPITNYQLPVTNYQLPVTNYSVNWSVQQLNAKGHIAWERGRVLWLVQKLVIPHQLQGYPLSGLCLRLALTWWADLAQIYVNGQLVQEGDLFDCSTRVLLSPSVTPGEEITIALKLVSPSHDEGALVRSLCIYESTSDEFPEPGFVADELAVMQRYLETFEPEKLANLADKVAFIDWSAIPDRQKFDFSLHTLRQNLIQSLILNPKSKIFLVGHAHLDLAWLWEVGETWLAAQRTFTSVLNLQQEFPELTFCHSTPALYAWIEQHRPDLFAAIQQQVKAGRWEIVGGLWVEPELNTIGGESIVRHLLYGQRYVQEKFGSISSIAWLPDTFGFPSTLPQFLADAGIEYFVTQKLRWNDTTEFPYGAFWWLSPDGTELFSLMSAPIGEGIDPLKMASYICDWETQTHLQQALWLPGVGDHGGGPTRDMLEVARRWQQSPFFPQLEFTTAQEYLQQIRSQEPGVRTRRGGFNKQAISQTDNLDKPARTEVEIFNSSSPPAPSAPSAPPALFPVWQDELYLEFHRGCYTTHGQQKRWNRRCEGLLYQAELFASLATLSTQLAYPQEQLEAAWKKVLFNQFHDILPGSAIAPVYVDANRAWQEAEQTATDILQQSLRAIASQIALPTPPSPHSQPIFVFNCLNWETSQFVEISLKELTNEPSFDWQICNLDGNELPSQAHLSESGSYSQSTISVSFLAKDIPPCGYRVFWLCPCKPSLKASALGTEFVLENEYLRVTINTTTGDLSSVFDKYYEREVLSGAGNQLQAFQDSGQYWDAWNIDPNYAQHPLPPAKLNSIEWVRGLVDRVRIVRQIGQSQFCQDYILETGAAILKIKTTVDWQERHVLVKAAFPLNLESEYATYEIPCGAIQRPTRPQTPPQKAKWEVPALHWADLSTDDYGVSLLNDCKYGYDSQPNQLRLTLLRSSNWPHPGADRGTHEFTYALYPHGGTWQSAHTVRRGYELNLPLQVMLLPSGTTPSGQMSAVSSLLDLSSENLILMAFKQSEDETGQFILRCYESLGETAQLSLQSDLGYRIDHRIDLLERKCQDAQSASPACQTSLTTAQTPNEQAFTISPWKIATFKVTKTIRKHAHCFS